jgi:sigma-B regulation protein RsbU (phosphoserine phosphatase)
MNSGRSTGFFEEIKFPQGSEVFSQAVTTAPPLLNSLSKITHGTRILIAEDDAVSCEILATRLRKWGYEAVITHNGNEAMNVMRSANAPALAVLDWMMPGMNGIEVCRRLREVNKAVYVIFLTSLGTKENIGQAMEAGVDDYLVKPFDTLALQTRISVGLRIIGLQTALAQRVNELEKALLEVKELRGQMSIPL